MRGVAVMSLLVAIWLAGCGGDADVTPATATSGETGGGGAGVGPGSGGTAGSSGATSSSAGGSGGSGGHGGLSVMECYADDFVNPPMLGPDYDQFQPVVGSHCMGTNHQDITTVE